VPPPVFPTPIAPKCGPVKAAKPVYHACREGDRARSSRLYFASNEILQKQKDSLYTKPVQNAVCIDSPVPPLSSCVTVRGLPGFRVRSALVCPLASTNLFGLSHRNPCTLASTNLQPRCCPPLHLFGLPRTGIHACLLAPICSHTAAPAAASFWPALLPTAASFWPPVAGIHAHLPAVIYSHAAARRCIYLACVAAHCCIFFASRAGIHACSPAPLCSHAAARRCIFLACIAARRCVLLAGAAAPTAASFYPTQLPAAASFCPRCCPRRCIFLACVAAHCCIFFASRAGIHACSPAPICSHTLLPAAASFWPALLPAAASCWPALLPPPLHLFGLRCCPPLHLFGLSRAGVYARLPALICSHAAARRCIFLARAAARCCILYGLPRR
jgi:hypothetical protein